VPFMVRPKKNPNRIVSFVSDEQMKELRKISEDNFGAPISLLVRRAIEEFITKNKQSS
jgi:hypothetical protein